MALLKLGDWDPDVFYKFRDIILNQVPTYGHKLRNDLCRGIPRVWVNHYTLDKDKDVAFEIGRFYYGIRDYANALEFYSISSSSVSLVTSGVPLFYSCGLHQALTHCLRRLFPRCLAQVGKHHVTSHNMGLCFYSMGQFPQALVKFEESLGLNKDYEKASSWREKVLQELAMGAAPKLQVTERVLVVDDDSSADEGI